MRFVIAALGVACLIWAAPARAEVAAATPSSFEIAAEADVATSVDRAWNGLIRLRNWWGDGHTYSGDAANLRLDARAGGCWCERWEDGEIEHARVVLVMRHEGTRTLRLVGGLGPLQELPIEAVLTFTVQPVEGGRAKIVMSYRVAGDSSLGLDQMAPLVDSVLMEQFGRLSRYTASGSPD